MNASTGMSGTPSIRTLGGFAGDVFGQQPRAVDRILPSLIQDNYAVVGGVEGYVHWLDLSDGKLAARMRLSKDAIRARPVVNGDTVYVEDVKGRVAAYRISGSP